MIRCRKANDRSNKNGISSQEEVPFLARSREEMSFSCHQRQENNEKKRRLRRREGRARSGGGVGATTNRLRGNFQILICRLAFPKAGEASQTSLAWAAKAWMRMRFEICEVLEDNLQRQMLILQGILIRRGRAAPPVSLRLGHARGLTTHRVVIQDPRAAALPALGKANAKRNQTKIYNLEFNRQPKFITVRRDVAPYGL